MKLVVMERWFATVKQPIKRNVFVLFYLLRNHLGLDPYELIGNPNLKLEINNQIDVSFLWNFAQITHSTNVFFPT